MEGYIYIILNKVNNKFYLGSTNNPHKRKLRHFRELSNNKHHSILLQRAINKYGIDNFEFILIETNVNYVKREQYLLDTIDLKESYNVSITASGGDFISNHPNRDEIIKISTEHLRNAPKPEPRFGKDNPNWKGGSKKCSCGKDIQKSAKTCLECKPISGENNPFYGKKHSEETKELIRSKRLGTYNGNQALEVCIDGVVYKSLSTAAKHLGVVTATISNRLKNDKFKNYNYV